MSAVVLSEVRRGAYFDSVSLMRLSQSVVAMDGVEEAALMMGTPSNKRLMADASILDSAGEAAEGGDLIIGIRAETRDAGEAAMARARDLLDQSAGRRVDGAPWRPRTIRAAVATDPDATLALISVPGSYATAEARKALRRGLDVMIFSDNVPLDEEQALKTEAAGLGRLVMGPDCGTAIIDGVPLAFANHVPRGPIGIVGASGTGMQEVSCLIAQAGGGVSHAIGVGGRDLRDEIGGVSTMMALDALERDPATQHIVLISKPPSQDVTARVMARVANSRNIFTVCFIGAGDIAAPPNATLAPTLKAAAESALGGSRIGDGFDAVAQARPPGKGRWLARGLFSGGTLCAEAQLLFTGAGERVESNAPIPGVSVSGGDSQCHVMTDLGDDEFTQGRPHPMIEPAVRDEPLGAALADPAVAIVLLDVVLGYGSHADPAGHLAAGLRDRPRDGPAVIASVTGTEGDPQIRSAQIAILEACGVLVAPSNADAAVLALACLKSAG